jgi:hypothetical protein
MPVFEIALQHKKQTKLNDCWYASTQMLKTYAKGTKTKAAGDHTRRLHSGLFGHTLNSDMKKSKHFEYVLAENDLVPVPRSEMRLYNLASVRTALEKYGPIIIGGEFYKVLFKKFGHYIVLAGVDTDKRTYKIYDPAWGKNGPEWISADLINAGSFNGDESNFAVDPDTWKRS